MPKDYHGGTSYHPRRPFFTTPGNPARAAPAERHRHLEALRLFASGMTWQAIADELGYAHRASAYNAVWTLMSRNPPRRVSEQRQRQNDALWLREDGWTWQAIADELGYATRSGAFRAAEFARQRQFRADKDRTIVAQVRG
ncbi:hypothetical protein QX204_24385 [Nocardia sp. PE-7]|uniref:hypothetical protein n=1 Tax=Nocardia sp. PE-7 TaxID=3058426 RepID=UPI0026590216|nr:hypothetical protein [Nocardia sp. PE-7]WKG08182.1 hypothetical protein QX204_24385 [Nocardia sp. PE-7]